MRQALFSVVFLCLSPLFAADFNDPQSYAYWESKIAAQPNLAINYFNLGVLYQKNNQPQGAIANYDKVIDLKSKLSPVALYYKAQVYESLHQINQAKQTVSLIDIKDVPENLKLQILSFKNKLFVAEVSDESEEKSAAVPEEKRVSLFLDYNQGSNSNPATYSSGSGVAITSDKQSQLNAGLDLLVDYTNSYDLKINYYYSQIRLDQQTSLDYAYHDVNVPLSFYIDKWRFKLSAEYFTDKYESALYSIQKGIAVDFSYKFSDQYLNLLIQSNHIKNETDTYSYLSGDQTKFLIGFEQRWAASKVVTKIYNSMYNYTDTATLGSSYQSWGLTLSYTKYFYDFELIASTTIEDKRYIKASADANARIDLRSYTNLQLAYNINSYFRIYIEGDYNLNSSNFKTTVNDKNYKQSLLLAGLSLSY